MTPAVLRHLVRRDGRRFRQRMERQMTMSDTTPTNAHEASIREAAERLDYLFGRVAPTTLILDHAEALARDLADAEARAEFDRAELQAVTDEHERTKAALAAERAGFAALVHAERDYQRQKWGDNDNVQTWPEWGAILGEEFGEVCRALKAAHWEGERADAAGRHGLRGELVQLAAICAAMVERIDDREAQP